ncbi:vascular-related unknown protein 1-like [Phoenix dactylifera]|uniref:Uncharacterized protein n=1 Tax=Phoenix dactylifera TaxID=42345 RepID=A0A8B9AMX6_PHODC|nr:vascular-related unknown protein 1-like [Phoenix dactylifera]
MMEESIHSSLNRSLSSKEGAPSSEESGWTMYFEDFLASEKREEDGCSFSMGGGSSVISDAASCAAWKPLAGTEATKSCKKLRFKKRKAGGTLDDDPLEDTASSPVNSPKVSYLNHSDVQPREKADDHNKGIPQEEAVGCGNGLEIKSNIVNDLGFVEGTNECTELKKRGLCLVPLSIQWHDIEPST